MPDTTTVQIAERRRRRAEERERQRYHATCAEMRAKGLLTHYFEIAGAPSAPDNRAEIEAIVDEITNAATARAVARMLEEDTGPRMTNDEARRFFLKARNASTPEEIESVIAELVG